MPKSGKVKKVGVPVPTPLPASVSALVCYYGAKGFTPAYDQADRVEVPIASVTQEVINGTNYFVFDPSTLPAPSDGEYDLYFTLEADQGTADKSDDEEGDFSPVLAENFPAPVPPTLGQPVSLDE